MSSSDALSALVPAHDTQCVRWIEVRNVTCGQTVSSHVELADTPRSRRNGLLSRDRLTPGKGLWIVPCEAVHTFGMSYPIDLVFIDKHRRVVRLVESIGPRRLSIAWRAHSVLELAPGSIRESCTRVGDSLLFSVPQDGPCIVSE